MDRSVHEINCVRLPLMNSKFLFFILESYFWIISLCFKQFSWDEKIKDVIQSSFFWGYVCTQIIGSMVAQRWGAHKLFSLAQFACGFVTLLIPVLAEHAGWEAFCVTRVIAGIFQGTVLPCLHALLSKWAPIEERGRICEYRVWNLYFDYYC